MHRPLRFVHLIFATPRNPKEARKIMSNPAPTHVPLNDIVRNRWSPRAFADKPVAPEVLRSLFEAARWAPSSSNEQPWAYIVATKENSADFAKMLSVLVEFNAGWAKNAAVVVLSVAHLKALKGDAPNHLALHDVGSASAQLTFEANSRGLLVHQMAGYDADKARQVFAIPQDWAPVAAMAIGYPGDPQSLPEKLREREVATRVRKPLAEFVMTGGWGHTASFVAK
jgi:nitroreductase